MDIKLSACFIPVDNHDKALAFYRDVLGLEVRNDVGFEGMRWVTVGAPSQPGVDLVLEPPLADPNASLADREAMAELLAKGLLRGVIFSTDDCDGTFERLRAALQTEHAPRGPTEAALVDRLSWIEWRRKRLQLAERASFLEVAYLLHDGELTQG